jgi:HTH-type transcriptional regulator/antitoxin HipB
MADALLTSTQLGRVLVTARKAKGLTQAAVAARVGLSQKRISAIELEPGRITVEQLLRLCAVLGLELSIGLKPAAGADANRNVEW